MYAKAVRGLRVAAIGAVVVCGLPVSTAVAAGHRGSPSHPSGHPTFSGGPTSAGRPTFAPFGSGSRGFFPAPHRPREFFGGSRRFFPRRPSVVFIAPVPFLPFSSFDYLPSYIPSPALYAAPPPVYAPPAPGYQAPGYYPPSYFPPSPQLDVETAPLPHVVVYPTGRYELRGDGVTTPYVWVWIPNPPAGPPAESPPPDPSSSPSSPPGGASAPTHVAYRWTDEQGVATWTDNLDKVPERFRARVEVHR